MVVEKLPDHIVGQSSEQYLWPFVIGFGESIVFNRDTLLTVIVDKMLLSPVFGDIFSLTLIPIAPESNQVGDIVYRSDGIPALPVPGIIVGNDRVLDAMYVHEGDISQRLAIFRADRHGYSTAKRLRWAASTCPQGL